MADFDMVIYDHYIRKGLGPSEALDKAMDKGKSSGKQKSTKHSSSGYGYDKYQPSSHHHYRDSSSNHRHGSSSRHGGGYEYDPYSCMAGDMGGMPFPGMSSSGNRHYGEDRSHRKHKSLKHDKYKHKESSSPFSGTPYDDIFSKLAEDFGGLGLGTGNDEEHRRAKPRHNKSSSRKHRVEDPEPEGYSYGYGTFSGLEGTKTYSFGDPPFGGMSGGSSSHFGGFPGGMNSPFGGFDSDDEMPRHHKSKSQHGKHKSSRKHRHANSNDYSYGYASFSGPEGSKTHTFRNPPGGDFFGAGGPFDGSGSGFGSGYGPGYGFDFDTGSRHHSHRGKSHTTSGRADKEPTFNYGTKPEKCLYKTLGVSRTASSSELRDGHRKLSLKYHPDRAPKGKTSEYTKKMADINSAYDALASTKVREMYDFTGRVIPKDFYTDFQIYLTHKKYDRG